MSSFSVKTPIPPRRHGVDMIDDSSTWMPFDDKDWECHDKDFGIKIRTSNTSNSSSSQRNTSSSSQHRKRTPSNDSSRRDMSMSVSDRERAAASLDPFCATFDTISSKKSRSSSRHRSDHGPVVKRSSRDGKSLSPVPRGRRENFSRSKSEHCRTLSLQLSSDHGRKKKKNILCDHDLDSACDCTWTRNRSGKTDSEVGEHVKRSGMRPSPRHSSSRPKVKRAAPERKNSERLSSSNHRTSSKKLERRKSGEAKESRSVRGRRTPVRSLSDLGTERRRRSQSTRRRTTATTKGATVRPKVQRSTSYDSVKTPPPTPRPSQLARQSSSRGPSRIKEQRKGLMERAKSQQSASVLERQSSHRTLRRKKQPLRPTQSLNEKPRRKKQPLRLTRSLNEEHKLSDATTTGTRMGSDKVEHLEAGTKPPSPQRGPPLRRTKSMSNAANSVVAKMQLSNALGVPTQRSTMSGRKERSGRFAVSKFEDSPQHTNDVTDKVREEKVVRMKQLSKHFRRSHSNKRLAEMGGIDQELAKGIPLLLRTGAKSA